LRKGEKRGEGTSRVYFSLTLSFERGFVKGRGRSNERRNFTERATTAVSFRDAEKEVKSLFPHFTEKASAQRDGASPRSSRREKKLSPSLPWTRGGSPTEKKGGGSLFLSPFVDQEEGK